MEVTKQRIIQELIQTNFVEKFTAQKLINRDKIPLEDAIQHVWLAILELDEERLVEWYKEGGINKVRQICSGIITRQVQSTSSSLYYQYVKKDCDNLRRKRKNDPKQTWDEHTGWNGEEATE